MKALETAGISNLCVAMTGKDGTTTDVCKDLTVAIADLSKNAGGKKKTLCTVAKSKDSYTLTLTIADDVCAPKAPKAADSLGGVLQRHNVRVDTEDFGLRFPPLIVDAIAFGSTSLPDIERPSRLERKTQIARVGVNLFLWDKFRERPHGVKAKLRRYLARAVGLNVTAGLNVAPASVASRTNATAVGLVLAIPTEERWIFVGYDVMVHGPDLKNRGFLFGGVSGREFLELIKKAF